MDSVLVGVIQRRIALNNQYDDMNKTLTWRAFIKLIDNQEEKIAIIKQIPRKQIVIETVCALLGRYIGLPIPRPMLVFDRDNNCFFGSEDIGHPDLRVNKEALELLKGWEHLHRACVFDEWIANEDRHDGNLLTDGYNFWLIDHELALNHLLDVDEQICNKLLYTATDSIESDALLPSFRTITQEIMAKCTAKVSNVINVTYSDTPEHIAKFIDDRLPHVFNLLENKVSTP